MCKEKSTEISKELSWEQISLEVASVMRFLKLLFNSYSNEVTTVGNIQKHIIFW